MDTNGKVTDTLPAGDKSGMLFFLNRDDVLLSAV